MSPAAGLIPLGPFDLTRCIGQGGMGEVWSGLHREQQVPVAVKVLTGKFARDPRFLAGFRSEVRAVVGLDHPSIVLVFDHGEITAEASRLSAGALPAGSPFLAMELCQGGTLGSRCGKLPWLTLNEVLLRLLAALGHAHGRGVVHRDLKPGNILLGGARSKVVLADFGLAHAVERDGTAPQRGAAGTPSYMAPEQFAGSFRDHGPWTDLYGLGCVTWALVTGAPPFGRSDDVQAMAMAHGFRPLPSLVPKVQLPAGFEPWLRRLLEKDPARRYRCAADAAWGLQKLGALSLGPDLGAPLPARMQLAAARGAARDEPGTPLPAQLGAEAVAREEPTRASERRREAFSEERTEVAAAALEETAGAMPTIVVPPPQGGGPPIAPAPLPPLPSTHRALEAPRSSVRLIGTGLKLYGLRPIPLVDREHERDALWAALRAVGDLGRARAVLLEGAAGCGKSRLAEWLGERAHEVGGAVTLKALHHASPGPADGLGPLLARQLRLGGLPLAEARSRAQERLLALGLSPSDAAGLQELAAPAFAAGGTAVRFGSPLERHALVRRFVSCLAEERPVLLWLDDVQWGADSLVFAHHLLEAQEREPAPILLVLTVRQEALAERTTSGEPLLLAAVAEREETTRLQISPLLPADRPYLVRELLGLEAGLAEKIEERTAGNPLFAVQLVGDWVERGLLELGEGGFRLRAGEPVALPDGLHEVWVTRVERLLSGRPAEDGPVLELAAVLGQEVQGEEWREAARLSGLVARDSLVELLALHRLAHSVAPEQGFGFVHGMLRESLLRRAAEAGRLRAHHRACVAMLRELPGAARAERLARHLVGAGELEAALEPLLTAARERQVTCDYRAAAALLDEREVVLSRLAAAADERLAENWAQRAQLLRVQGEIAAGAELAVRAEEAARSHGWPRVLTRALRARGRLAHRQGEFARAVALLEEAWAGAVAGGEPELAHELRMEQGFSLTVLGSYEQARSCFLEALPALELAGDLYSVGGCLFGLGRLEVQRGKLGPARELLARCQDCYERLGFRLGVTECVNLLGEVTRMQGHPVEAERLYRAAVDGFQALGLWSSSCLAEANIGSALIEQGRAGEARGILEGCLAELSRSGIRPWIAVVRAALLSCSVAEGDRGSFAAHAAEVELLVAETRVVEVDLARLARIAGESAARRGFRKEARRAYAVAAGQFRALGRDDELAAVEAAADALRS